MAEFPAGRAGDRFDADDDADPLVAVDRVADRPSSRDLVDALIERARIRLAWVGAGRLIGGAGGVLVIAGIGWWLLRSPSLPTEAALPAVTHQATESTVANTPVGAPTVPFAVVATSESPGVAIVHVTGAVNRPGVYELVAGQRVDDALAAAGGPTPDADPNALNLAAPVADGDRIEVPVIGAPATGAAAGSGHTHASPPDGDGAPGDGPVDLNVATPAELERLPGIGPATATAIVEFRTQNGPFGTVDQLLDVPGIGPAKLEAIRDAVTT